jgi:hypothetical protein
MINMTKLTKLLDYNYAGNNERSRMRNTSSFKRNVLDTLSKEQKELLISDASDADELLQESVYDAIIAGATPARCMRDVIPTVGIGDHQMRVTYASGGANYATDVAEGAAIPLNEDQFNTVTITPKKVGVRPLITNEMIEDELWSMVEWHLRWAGGAIENKLNKDCLDDFIAGTTVSDKTGAGSIDNIAAARGSVTTNGWNPDKMVIAPGFETDLLAEDNFMQAYQYGDNSILKTGNIPGVLGMNVHKLSIVTGDTYTWGGGFDAASEYGALIFDSKAPFMMLGMKRDISIEQYDDPIHDLVGIAATMRYGTGIIHGDAGVAWKQS